MGICGTNLEDNDMFMDVKACFADYVENGETIDTATELVMVDYKEELSDEDDAVFVVMALADAQQDAGGVLASTKKLCLKAIEKEIFRIKSRGWNPIDSRKYEESLRSFERYIQKHGTKKRALKTPVKCTWKVGDVYALPLMGAKADLCGLTGHYLLLRMIEPYPVGRDIFPNVYESVSAKTVLPKTEEDISSAKYIQTTFRGTYRIGLIARSQEEFDLAGFQYLGNFQHIEPPENEVVLPQEKLIRYGASTLLENIVDGACKSYAYVVLGKKLS